MTEYIIPIQIFNFQGLGTSLDEDDDFDTVPSASTVPAGIHLFVKVDVGGNTYEMVLDTGASQTVIDPDFVPQFVNYLSAQNEIESAGINSDVQVEAGVLLSFSIGGLKIDRMNVGLTSMQHINMVYGRISNKKVFGLLGSETLAQYQAVIDYGKKTLTLFA
jgi:hypothetical protein